MGLGDNHGEHGLGSVGVLVCGSGASARSYGIVDHQHDGTMYSGDMGHEGGCHYQKMASDASESRTSLEQKRVM